MNFYRLLDDNRTVITNFIYKMCSGSRYFNASFKSLFVDFESVKALAAERRDKRRMHVYYAAVVSAREFLGKYAHESGKYYQLCARPVDTGRKSLFEIRAAGKAPAVHRGGGDHWAGDR